MEKQDKFEKYLEIAKTIFISLDKKGKIIYANKKAEEVLGCSKEKLIGKNWFENFVPKRLQKEMQEVFKKLTKNELKPVEFYENLILTKKNEEKLIAWRNSILRDEKGNILEIISSGEDITEKKKIENSLQESEEKFKEIYEKLPMAYQSLDKNGNFNEINPAWLKILGYKKEEVIGESFTKFISKEDSEKFKENFEKFKQIGNTNVLFLMKKKNSEYISVEFTGNIEYDKDKKFKKTHCIFKDITEKEKKEEKINQEQEMNRVIVNSMPGAFYILDKEGSYFKWNAYQAEKIIGKPEEKILGMKAIETIHPEDRELLQSRITNVLAKGTIETVEGRVLLKGGPNYIWMLMTGQRIFLNKEPFLIGTGIDITDKKETEKETEKFQEFVVGRELKMIELKKEIADLKKQVEKKKDE